MIVYIPLGTCYQCDRILPAIRISYGRPRSFFCSDRHQHIFAKLNPAQYAEMREQSKALLPRRNATQ